MEFLEFTNNVQIDITNMKTFLEKNSNIKALGIKASDFKEIGLNNLYHAGLCYRLFGNEG